MSLLKIIRERKRIDQYTFGQKIVEHLGGHRNWSNMVGLISLWEEGFIIPSEEEKTAICAILEVAETDIEFGAKPLTMSSFMAQPMTPEDFSAIQKLLGILPKLTWGKALESLIDSKNNR